MRSAILDLRFGPAFPGQVLLVLAGSDIGAVVKSAGEKRRNNRDF
jgi:hypothetical protein